MAHSGNNKLALLLAATLALGAADYGLSRYLTRDASTSSVVTLRAQGTGPILPLSYDARGDVPFLAEAARDPEIANKKPEDESDATRLAAELKSLRSDLTRSKGERAAELNEDAYKSALALVYFFESQGPKGAANAASMRQIAAHHIAALLSQLNPKKDAAQIARAQFNSQAMAFAAGNRGQAVANLTKLAKGRLPAALKARAALMTAIHTLDAGRANERNKALATVNSSAKMLSADGQIAVHLLAARAAAGLGRNGQKVSAASPAYKNQLMAATQRAEGLTDARKAEVLRFAVGVWRAAEGTNAAWDKVPFKLSPFNDTLATKAIAERAALANWAAGDRVNALKKYQALSAALAGQQVKADIDLRVLDLYRMDFALSKNPRAYEQALLRTSKIYLDPTVLGDGTEAKAKAVAAEISRRHGGLVDGELTRAASPHASKAERLAAIDMAKTYMANSDDKVKIESVQGRVGSLYALNGQHAEAVAVFKELADAAQGAKKAGYLALAITSQSVLASWPKDAPWAGFAAGHDGERQELLAQYQAYDAADGKGLNWSLLAHEGLLMAALGQPEQAFASWQAALKKDVHGLHAANATGYMLVAYQKAAAWGALESLSRLALKAPIAAQYRLKPVPVMEMFELALLEGGKEALEAKKFKLAVAKLKEFTNEHQKAKNHDEGFFLLASAYRGDSQHKAAIETLLAFVDRYQSSKYYRAALLQGGDWSAPMAYEDNAMFFYQRFATQFAADPEADRVRDLLTDLYVGRGLYAEALAVLNAVVKAPTLGADKKAEALVQIMGIEERQGSPDRAVQAADLLVRASDAPTAAKAEALAVKARAFARKGDANGLHNVEAQAVSLGNATPEAQQALGETRYYLAVAGSKTVIQKFFNLELRDPLQTIEQRFAGFAQAKAAFLNVCAAGQSSFCAPAMHKLARIGEDFSKTLEDINIQETLAADAVTKFKTRKQAIMNDVMRVVQNADGKAVAVVAQGYTDPKWTQAVLWQNSSDWNFERVSGEAGNGYVQWSNAKKQAKQQDAE